MTVLNSTGGSVGKDGELDVTGSTSTTSVVSTSDSNWDQVVVSTFVSGSSEDVMGVKDVLDEGIQGSEGLIEVLGCNKEGVEDVLDGEEETVPSVELPDSVVGCSKTTAAVERPATPEVTCGANEER